MTLYLGIAVFALSVIALIYLFLISPRLTAAADMELLRVDYAHRGLWNGRMPENSLSAFEAAARKGFGIELDVRLTKDKRIVVFHDDSLKRMCGVNANVSDLTLEQIKDLRLLGTNERIPTLAEVLRLVDGRVPLLIEFKGERPEKELCLGAARMLDIYGGAFCVESFSPLILRWFKKYRPTYGRGQLVTNDIGPKRPHGRKLNFVLSRMLTNFISRPDFIAIKGDMRRSLAFLICVKAFHVSGFIWTVRDPKTYEGCKRAGYYAIFERIIPKNVKGSQQNEKML